MNDLISDMFARIQNALKRKKEIVDIRHSNLSFEVARILTEEGFIQKHEVLTRGKRKLVRISLKYVYDKFGKPSRGVISSLKRMSRPGCRMYVSYKDVPRIRCGLGSVILTTPRGVMTDAQARKGKIGGEVIGFVY